MEMTFQNVLDADGIGIAITGMFVVFSGLVLISLYISSIPGVLSRLENGFRKQKKDRIESPKPAAKLDSDVTELNDDMLAAIAYVIRMEREFDDADDYQRITVVREDAHQVWAVTGRLRNLSTRM